MFIDSREWEVGRGSGGGRGQVEGLGERDRQTDIPVCAQTRDQIRNLLAYGRML